MLRGLRMARIRPSRLRILNAGVKIRIGFTKKTNFQKMFENIKQSRFSTWGVGGMGGALYAAPRRGSEACETLLQRFADISKLKTFPGVPPLPPTPPKWRGPRTPKIIKNSDLKKNAFFSQNGAPSAPNGTPKIKKISKSASQGGTFYPSQKTSQISSIFGPSRTF